MKKWILMLLAVWPLAAQAETLKIDLPAALRLAEGQNSVLALQLEKLKHADVEVDVAKHQWIPTLRLGTGYTWQDGALQDTTGAVSNVERNAQYTGVGTGAVGSGLPARPGLSLNLNISEAIYQPLAAKQRRRADLLTSEAVRLQVMLRVIDAYYQLVSAARTVEIGRTAQTHAEQLADVTARFAESGEGLTADSERAAVEMLLQQQRVELALERLEQASIELIRLLRLDEDVSLRPTETTIQPLSLLEKDIELSLLVERAMAQRPEIDQGEASLSAERTQMKQEKVGLFIPRVEVGYSTGNFGGGTGAGQDYDDDRSDLYGMVYWQFDQLGLGSHAKTRRQRIRIAENLIRNRQVKADISAQVKTAFQQYNSSQRRLEIVQRAVQSAQRAFDLNKDRIYQNKGLPLEAMQSMRALAQAESLYLDIAAKFNTSQFRLLAATGVVKTPE